MKYKRLVITSLLSLLLSLSVQAQTVWQQISPHMEYTKLKGPRPYPWSHLHAFRFSLRHYQLQVIMARNMNNARAAHVSVLAKNAQALLGINGGFFSPQLRPLGLRISGGQQLNTLKPISWWGVLFTAHRHAKLVSMRHFQFYKGIDFAVQGGPRLIIGGRIPKLKPGVAERSAIGIDKKGRIVIVVTDKSPMSTKELAQVMRAPESENGLNCRNALNLDGGSSSQLYAQLADFKLEIPGYAAVTDAVVVAPRP